MNSEKTTNSVPDMEQAPVTDPPTVKVEELKNVDEQSEKDEDEGAESQKTASFKAMAEGHTTLKTNLEKAKVALMRKEVYLKELQEEVSRQKEQNWLMEEKIRSLTERECQMTRIVATKEKEQESLFKELSETKWKLQEANQFLRKLENDKAELKKKQVLHQEKITTLEKNSGADQDETLEQLREEVKHLEDCKIRLENGDLQLCSIKDGTKMLELEQRKRDLQDALNEQGTRCEALYLEIDEQNEQIEAKKKAIEDKKKESESKIWQLKNQFQCLVETEQRLQRSLDYFQAKIDYGMDVPVPPAWPNLKSS